jgi:hypothetical protein
MKNEKKLLEKFQVEELEKRYEFAWVDSVKIGGSYEGVGVHVTVKT